MNKNLIKSLWDEYENISVNSGDDKDWGDPRYWRIEGNYSKQTRNKQRKFLEDIKQKGLAIKFFDYCTVLFPDLLHSKGSIGIGHRRMNDIRFMAQVFKFPKIYTLTYLVKTTVYWISTSPGNYQMEFTFSCHKRPATAKELGLYGNIKDIIQDPTAITTLI